MPVALGGRCRSRKVGLRTALRRSDRARHEAVFEDTIVDSSQHPAHAQQESDVLCPEGRRCKRHPSILPPQPLWQPPVTPQHDTALKPPQRSAGQAVSGPPDESSLPIRRSNRVQTSI